MKWLIKKIIFKYLKSSTKHYCFLRWLAELIKDEKVTKDVYSSIAYWLFTHDDTAKYLQFSDIFVVDNIVYIYTFRPGLWIGKAGRTVDDLMHSMNYNARDKKIHDYRINFIEERHSAWADIHIDMRVLNKIYQPDELVD